MDCYLLGYISTIMYPQLFANKSPKLNNLEHQKVGFYIFLLRNTADCYGKVFQNLANRLGIKMSKGIRLLIQDVWPHSGI